MGPKKLNPLQPHEIVFLKTGGALGVDSSVSRIDSIQIELRLHERLFFIGLLTAIASLLWMFVYSNSASTLQFVLFTALTSLAVGFSFWNFRYFRRLLKELGNEMGN